MEKDLLKDSEIQSLFSFSSLDKPLPAPKVPFPYEIISVRKIQPSDNTMTMKSVQLEKKKSDKLTEPSFQDDEYQNLANRRVNLDEFDESLSVCSSQTSLFSKLTVTNDRIQYKINIVGNEKYQILQNLKQDPNQVNFKKIPIQKPQQISSSKQTVTDEKLELKQIPIQKFFTQKNSWDQLDEINKSDPGNQKTYMIYRQILNSDKIEINQNSHQEIKAKIVTESQKEKNSYFTIMLALQNYLKSIHPSIKVIFCQNSSIKTQVSMKIISTGFAFQKFKCIHKIKKKIQYLTFESIISDQKKFDLFETWYSQYFKFQFLEGKNQPINIKLTSISKLLQGDLCVQWDTYQPEIINDNPEASKRIKVTPYFQKFYLSIEDFDTARGNIKFPQIQNKVYRRGNYLYFPPQNCSRFSIKVWDKFDSGNNQWLSMNNNQNQWPSAFFGLYNPKIVNFDKKQIDPNLFKQTKSEDSQPIMQLKKILKDTISVNKNQKIGQGIICTPYMWNALQDTQQVEVNGQKYVLVFQCRLNPNKLKITQKEEYWMINQFSDVRPYGIILVPKQIKKIYPNPQERFKLTFSYIQLKKYLDSKMETKSKV